MQKSTLYCRNQRANFMVQKAALLSSFLRVHCLVQRKRLLLFIVFANSESEQGLHNGFM